MKFHYSQLEATFGTKFIKIRDKKFFALTIALSLAVARDRQARHAVRVDTYGYVKKFCATHGAYNID